MSPFLIVLVLLKTLHVPQSHLWFPIACWTHVLRWVPRGFCSSDTHTHVLLYVVCVCGVDCIESTDQLRRINILAILTYLIRISSFIQGHLPFLSAMYPISSVCFFF